MRVHGTHPTKPSTSASQVDAKKLTSNFDKAMWFDDTGYDKVSTLPKVGATSVPKGSDAANALKVFSKWADGAELHSATIDGQKLFALTWNADETGGVELFDKTGKRLAAQGYGEEGGGPKAWEFGGKSRWFDEAKSDLNS